MNRYRYGNNFETTNLGGVMDLLPLGYVEVVPGDTVGGSVSVRLMSDVTVRPIYSRGYFDVYAFHCPFRLLADEWSDFIRTGLGVLPTVANQFKQNFEPDAVAHPVWFRRMYNTVWNRFFRSAANPIELAVDQANIVSAEYRKSTFFESLQQEGFGIEGETTVPVDTLAGSVSIDDLREGFAVDRIKKLRGFYGNKYTDFLASLGVEAGWAVLEEPEVIGKKGADLVYRTTKATFQGDIATGQNALAQPGGQWEGHITLPVRRTFCPEHGVIGFFAVMRLERYNVEQTHPLLKKLAYEDYWRPELQYQRRQDVTWALGNNGAAQVAVVPPFEDLRKGANLAATQSGTVLSEQYANLYSSLDQTVQEIIAPNRNTFDTLFQGVLAHHYQVFNQFRLVKHSPVKPDVRNIGVQ